MKGYLLIESYFTGGEYDHDLTVKTANGKIYTRIREARKDIKKLVIEEYGFDEDFKEGLAEDKNSWRDKYYVFSELFLDYCISIVPIEFEDSGYVIIDSWEGNDSGGIKYEIFQNRVFSSLDQAKSIMKDMAMGQIDISEEEYLKWLWNHECEFRPNVYGNELYQMEMEFQMDLFQKVILIDKVDAP